MAWLDSRQAKSTEPRRATVDFEMPDIEKEAYLIDLAYEVGFTTEWKELRAWQELTGTPLTPFEAKAIRYVGSEYANAYREFDGTNAPRPYYDKSKPREIKRLSQRV